MDPIGIEWDHNSVRGFHLKNPMFDIDFGWTGGIRFCFGEENKILRQPGASAFVVE
jgi:hypothetical protein